MCASLTFLKGGGGGRGGEKKGERERKNEREKRGKVTTVKTSLFGTGL